MKVKTKCTNPPNFKRNREEMNAQLAELEEQDQQSRSCDLL